MKVFASKQFLLLISAPTLREYTEAHVVYPRITVDWSVEPETFASAIHDAVDALDAAMGEVADPAERKAIEADLSHWHDDLRRAHLLSNRLAIQELRSAIESDVAAVAYQVTEKEARGVRIQAAQLRGDVDRRHPSWLEPAPAQEHFHGVVDLDRQARRVE